MTLLLDRLLGQDLGRPALWRPHGPALDYGTLVGQSAALASRLLDGRRSLEGARVALLLPPGDSFVVALFAIWRAGGVAVPLSALHTKPELAHMLTTAAPVATLVDGAHAGAINGLEDTLTGARLDLSAPYHGDGSGAAAGPETVLSLPLRGECVAPDVRGDHGALMLFTSGTTGKPKGVLLSHAGVAATLSSLEQAWHWQAEDRLLHALPLYHTHGLVVALLGALWAGATVRFTSFDAAAIWDALADVSVFMAVPTMYVRLVETFLAAPVERRARWGAGAGALRLFTSGSAALPAALLGAFAEATGQTILERYGMTEIGMALSNPYQGPRVAGLVGVPLPGVEVDIVDDNEAPAAQGQPGELRIRSPQLFLGYHGDAAATAASYDGAGRFRTGDTGVRDERGFVRLLGRTSVDILKSGGYKLSALEIEDVLRAHPGVADVAVIGVPDPVWGDCVTACVVPRTPAGGSTVTLDELRDFARAELAPYKLPRALRLVEALPRNSMGKIQKSLLK